MSSPPPSLTRSMPSEAAAVLRDMDRHIRLAIQFVEELDFATFQKDERTIFAVIRCLEVVSEASRRLPDELKARQRTETRSFPGPKTRTWGTRLPTPIQFRTCPNSQSVRLWTSRMQGTFAPLAGWQSSGQDSRAIWAKWSGCWLGWITRSESASPRKSQPLIGCSTHSPHCLT